jgi:hypothetical protein
LPGAREPIPLESTFEDAFQQPVLTIPPRSLPVGKYVVHLIVTLKNYWTRKFSRYMYTNLAKYTRWILG